MSASAPTAASSRFAHTWPNISTTRSSSAVTVSSDIVSSLSGGSERVAGAEDVHEGGQARGALERRVFRHHQVLRPLFLVVQLGLRRVDGFAVFPQVSHEPPERRTGA